MQVKIEENEKYRRNRRKFLFIWFFFLTVFLSTVTYAWFSSNRIVDLQFFDIHVETDGGLEISEDAIAWKSEITTDEFRNAYKTYGTSVNQIPSSMRPTSSGGLLDSNGYLNIFYGQADSGGTKNFYLTTYREIEERTTENNSNGDFIAFDIFFKTTTSKPLYLSSESFVKPKEGDSLGIENSARIAFINEGTLPIDTVIARVQTLKTTNNNNVYIWEPNYDVHTEHGVSNAKNIYDIDTTLTNAQILPYDGVIGTVTTTAKVELSKANANNYPDLFKKVDVDVYSKSEYNDNKYLFELEAGITKMRVYMWLEGQDVDSENKASHGDISYSIEFTLNP